MRWTGSSTRWSRWHPRCEPLIDRNRVGRVAPGPTRTADNQRTTGNRTRHQSKTDQQRPQIKRTRTEHGRMSLSPYVPIVGLFALAAAFAVFSVGIAPLVGPRRYNRAKLDAYECGIEPTPQPVGGGRFPVKF